MKSNVPVNEVLEQLREILLSKHACAINIKISKHLWSKVAESLFDHLLFNQFSQLMNTETLSVSHKVFAYSHN